MSLARSNVEVWFANKRYFSFHLRALVTNAFGRHLQQLGFVFTCVDLPTSSHLLPPSQSTLA